jgi:hypothetical protein
MKIKCLHGYFIFEEDSLGDVSKFMSLFTDLEIVAQDDYFVFSDLYDFPKYSLVGKDLLGQTATATIEGKPWEILEANGLVYNFNTGLLRPIATVTKQIVIFQTSNYYLTQGLIMPGSRLRNGTLIASYFCNYSFNTGRFRYSEVSFE